MKECLLSLLPSLVSSFSSSSAAHFLSPFSWHLFISLVFGFIHNYTHRNLGAQEENSFLNTVRLRLDYYYFKKKKKVGS